MVLFDTSTLKSGVTPREVFSWALFDAANSGYSTVVMTAVFNAFFVTTVCSNAPWATFLWSCAVALGNALSMLLMPVIGRIADLRATKKKWLVVATLVCVAATALLAYSGPGTYILSVAMIVVSLIGYNVGESLNSAFLPEIAKPESIGKISGWGWSLGYVGGLVTLALCLAAVLIGQSKGVEMTTLVGGSCIITAVVFVVVALPVFVWLKERSRAQIEHMAFTRAFKEAGVQLRQTLSLLKPYRDFRYLVVCGFLYQCGIATVIALAAIYASSVMGFEMTDTLILVLLVNITAAVGAFAFGYIQDRLGHKKALALTLCVWIAMVITAASAQDVWVFWVSANLAGLAMGSSQSAGRAMVGVFAPKACLAQFYGFWNMALWLSAIVGPMTYGAVTWITGSNHRLAIVVTGIFFVLGLIVLAFVNVKRGQQMAQEAEMSTGYADSVN